MHLGGLSLSLAGCPPSGSASVAADVAAAAGPLPEQCYYSYIDPGAFALIGAAAFFGGVSRLTIALTVIMIEITNDVRQLLLRPHVPPSSVAHPTTLTPACLLTPSSTIRDRDPQVRFLLPIMLSVMVAKWIADAITHSLYHAIIEAKCLPFLSPEVSLHGAKDGDLEKHTVSDLLGTLGHGRVVSVRAWAEESYGSLAKTLSETDHGAYPVVDEQGRFQGSVARSQILAVLTAVAKGGSAIADKPLGYLELLTAAEKCANDPQGVAAALDSCGNDAGLSARPCDLSPYIDSSAVSVRDQFSLHRAYMLFRTMGLRHLYITDADNLVVGVLTRRDLMDFRLHDVLHPHGHGDGHGHGHGHGVEVHLHRVSMAP